VFHKIRNLVSTDVLQIILYTVFQNTTLIHRVHLVYPFRNHYNHYTIKFYEQSQETILDVTLCLLINLSLL